MRRPSHSNDLRRRIVAAYVTKALVERALQGDATHHLGYEKRSGRPALRQHLISSVPLAQHGYS